MYKNKSLRRRYRNRARLQQRSPDRPRLSIHRSGKHIYAQIIDDMMGNTLCAASSLDRTLRAALNSGSDKIAASKVGNLIAERALQKGVTKVVFDRGQFRFHGRVKALAEGAREGGLVF
ncbi:MAG: 50S ribosomal protein L18 [Magnetovibrio sp.]|nr:50S ribosomal protein L18 [Magnetovibrio sp.]